MSRPSQTESVYVQTLPDGKCLCPDFLCVPKENSCAPKLIICAIMSRLLCVQRALCPDYRAFKIAYVQTVVRSKLQVSRLSCVQNCICPDYRAFKIANVQTIVRSFFFPDRVILNARRHLVRSFRSGHIDFRSGTSTWVRIEVLLFTNRAGLNFKNE